MISITSSSSKPNNTVNVLWVRIKEADESINLIKHSIMQIPANHIIRGTPLLAQSRCYSFMTFLGSKLDMIYYFT